MHTSKKSRRRRLSPAPSFRHSAPRSPAATTPPNPPFRGDPSAPARRASTAGTAGREALPSGRAVSARNATTHGLFARDVVLPALGEDPAAFDALLAQLCAQLPPRNILERHYLEQIAAASWRLRRLHRWQAQVYEDATIDEDRRLDKLDKTLRHDTALTRQIDRAVRLLGRDLRDLFGDRARDTALREHDTTEAECRRDPDLAMFVQRSTWDTVYGPLAAPTFPRPAPDTQICENEPSPSDTPAPSPRSVTLVHSRYEASLPIAGRDRVLAPEGGDDAEEYEDPDDAYFIDPRWQPQDAGKKCENEKCENEPQDASGPGIDGEG